AIERRLHPDGVAARSEELAQDPPALLLLCLARRIQRLAQVSRSRSGRDELRIERIVRLACNHLLSLGPHRSPSAGRTCKSAAARVGAAVSRDSSSGRPLPRPCGGRRKSRGWTAAPTPGA